MKVLHVTSGNLFGGIETMLVTIARFRDAAPDMESQFAVCFDGRLKSELEATGAPVHDLGAVRARSPFGVRRARRTLRTTIERQGIDVVVCHSSWPLAIFGPVAMALRRSLVLWQHGVAAEGVGWLERWASRARPDVVICNSEFTAATMRGASARSRVDVVYCPVDRPARSEFADLRRSQLRTEFSTLPAEVVIVQVSRLEPWKGHGLHLMALSKLKNLEGWVCWIAGGAQRPSEQQYLLELKRFADAIGIGDRVRYLGQRTDVGDVLLASDIHCQPNSRPEPFGIAFVEALYAGLPVVSTAAGGVLEIVDDTCGRLARPDDVDDIARHLRALIEEPELRRRLGAAGPARASRLCDPARQTRLIEQVLSRARPAEWATA